MTSTSTKTTTALTTAAAAATLLVVARFLKRRLCSPEITCQLQCQCGHIQGSITARWEDSICINCYCDDCRQYARFVATAGKADTNTNYYCGCDYTRVVQVCKSALQIIQGHDQIQLTRKGPTPAKGQVYMHRYYAKCCRVPLYNTVDFLGFVGVFRDNLVPPSNVTAYDGPVRMFPEQALPGTVSNEPDIFAPAFLWKLLRYHWWSKAGPFDYEQTPEYWGGDEKNVTTVPN